MNAEIKPASTGSLRRAVLLSAGVTLLSGLAEPVRAEINLPVLPAAAAKQESGEKKKPARDIPRLLMRAGAPTATRITWRNGEQLKGALAAADEAFLEWKTPLFTDPLKLKKEAVQRIDFATAFFHPEGAFRLVLTDGSHLTGELEKIDGETCTLKTKDFGTVAARRDQVVCLERIGGVGVLTGGPQALLPDKVSASETVTSSGVRGGVVFRNRGTVEPEPLFLAAAGRAASPAFGLTSQRDLDLPDKCMVEILLRTDSVPDLTLRAARDSESASVETWGDELVLVQGDQFKSAGVQFGEKDRTAHLRLAWDRPAGRCALYGPDGKLWAEITPPKKEPAPKEPEAKPTGSWLRRLFGDDDAAPQSKPPSYGRGVSLTNKGSSIIVERFWVSEWSGEPPPAASGDAACIETVKEVISGEPAGCSGNALTVRLADGKTREVPLDDVRAIRFPRQANLERDPSLIDLWFADGNLLHGKVTSVKDGKASVETPFAAAPVIASLEHCRTVMLTEPEKEKKGAGAEKKPDALPALDKLDVISDGEYTLHGTIQTAGGLLPRFQPVGAVAALMPAESKNLTITRSVPADGKFERAPALLHVKTGETLPVTLKAVTREKIEFEWDAAESREIDPAKVHAIQFAAPAIVKSGFDAGGWQMIGDSGKGASRRGGSITLQPGSGIGHPYLLQGSDLSFRMSRQSGGGFTSLRIRLFCQGTDSASQSLNFLIGDFGGEIYCGIERTPGQMENQMEVPSKGSGCDIRISFPGDQVELYVNGVSAASTAVKGRTGKKSGTGFILETASLWGNQIGPVKLSDFSMQSSSCLAGPPAFSEEARREALLLPRMRRDDPPRQVLIGRNGDLLRGEIEAMTSTHLSFRSGLETFKVPLERVAAAVWVKKPEKAAPGKEEKPEDAKKTAGGADGDGEDAAPAGRIRLNVAQKLAGMFTIKAAVAGEARKEPEAKPEPAGKESKDKDGKATDSPAVQWLDLTNGGRLGLTVESWSGDKVTGRHPLLGRCSIPSALVYRLSVKTPPPAGALAVLADWTLVNTPDPVLPEDEGTSSPLAGKGAPDFKLPMLEGEDFALSNARGKVVVLDFWATWCGPCVKSLPGLVETMASFPADKAILVAVNQGETKVQVKQFLEARGLKMAVAMDGDQSVARKYGVEGIPHTVVISLDGKVAFVKTGYEPDGDKKIAEAVRKALPDATEEKPADKPAEGKPADASPDEPLLPAPKLN